MFDSVVPFLIVSHCKISANISNPIIIAVPVVGDLCEDFGCNTMYRNVIDSHLLAFIFTSDCRQSYTSELLVSCGLVIFSHSYLQTISGLRG